MDRFILSSKQKVPFVCFNCRTSVKTPLPFSREGMSDQDWGHRRNVRCPNCNKPMAYLGCYFKVPPRSALNQWRKAELLWRNGWIADGYSGAPRTLRDAREFTQKPTTATTCRALKRRAENEEKWRRFRAKREHLQRHKAA